MAGLWLLAGCAPAGDTVGPVVQTPAGNVTLRVVAPQEYEEVLAAHRGQVVLADFWATWCVPCREQFPHTVALYREHRDDGLAVISVSLDDPDDREGVLDFLRGHGATFDNLLSEAGGGPESILAFDITGGALPHYKVYDREGTLRHTFGTDPLAERPFTHDDVAAAVQELLAEE